MYLKTLKIIFFTFSHRKTFSLSYVSIQKETPEDSKPFGGHFL